MGCHEDNGARLNGQIAIFQKERLVCPLKNLNIAANIYNPFPVIIAKRPGYNLIDRHHFAADFHVS